MARRDLLSRLERHFVPEPNTGCWLWFGARLPRGYGRTSLGKRRPNVYAHRLMHQLLVGPVGGLQVLHRCDTPECVNPDHLFLGSQTDNMRDAARKGRTRGFELGGAAGELNVKAKLTEADVQAIRRRRAGGESRRALAVEFNVTSVTIRHIDTRQTWRTP